MKKPEDYFRGRPIHKVLMVCLGNICRSPLAEYLLRDKLKKAGIEDILEKSEMIPEKGASFQASVQERLLSISDWVTRSEHITDKMKEAVRRLGGGVDRWVD